MSSIKLKIVTPEKLLLETEASQVTLPVTFGEVTVLPEHIPYIGALSSGEVRFVEAAGDEVRLAREKQQRRAIEILRCADASAIERLLGLDEVHDRVIAHGAP